MTPPTRLRSVVTGLVPVTPVSHGLRMAGLDVLAGLLAAQWPPGSSGGTLPDVRTNWFLSAGYVVTVTRNGSPMAS